MILCLNTIWELHSLEGIDSIDSYRFRFATEHRLSEIMERKELTMHE